MIKIFFPKRVLLMCFLYILLILSIDILTTIIALEFFGATESNSIAAYLISTFGLFGYLFTFLFIIGYLAFRLILLCYIFSLIYYSIYKVVNKQHIILIIIIFSATYVFMDLLAILNNLGVIWTLLK